MTATLRTTRRRHNGATGQVVEPVSFCLDYPAGLVAVGAAAVQSQVVSAAPDVLRAVRLRKTFASEAAPVRALRGVDLAVAAGEFVAVTGPSGCGKSTLLNLVAGLETPGDGEIYLAGERLGEKDESELAHMRRRHIGFVFQFFNLLEETSALENVALAAVIAGASRRRAEVKARELLDLLGLPDKADDLPGVLSGGQRQRLAIARALANEPTLLLADEPTGALDSAGGLEVLELFRRLHARGQTILLVTHDQRVAGAAQRVVRMQDGRLVGSTVTAPAVRALGG
jgi:putative ABC transport system ATP-binding protein